MDKICIMYQTSKHFHGNFDNKVKVRIKSDGFQGTNFQIAL